MGAPVLELDTPLVPRRVIRLTCPPHDSMYQGWRINSSFSVQVAIRSIADV